MKKRNCRKTDLEREQHDRAIRIRKMTDAQLCEYIDNLTRQPPSTTSEEIIISEQEYRKLGCDERKRILYQGSVVKYA